MQPNEPQAPDQAPVQPQDYAPQPSAAPASMPVQPEASAPLPAPTQQPIAPAPAVETDYPPQDAQQSAPLADDMSALPPTPDAPTQLPDIQPVNWQAQEYLQHDKTPGWYVAFAIVTCLFVTVAIFLQAWTFVVLVPVMAVALLVYTHRPPHVINYTISDKGLYINDTLHPMGEFKAFSVMQSPNPDQNQLILVPVKRFRPGLTILFPSEVGEQLVDTLGAFLPDRPYQADAFDKIIQKLHI